MKTLVSEYKNIPVNNYYFREGSVGGPGADQGVLLETYFNDIYRLFLNKLVKITYDSSISDEDVSKLRQLFEEIIKVKSLIQEGK